MRGTAHGRARTNTDEHGPATSAIGPGKADRSNVGVVDAQFRLEVMQMRAAQIVAAEAMADYADGRCQVEVAKALVSMAVGHERTVDNVLWPNSAEEGR